MGAKISIIYFKIIEVDVTNLLHLRAKMNRKREPSKFMPIFGREDRHNRRRI